jgi:non-specific serine/threonine protein kinase/serine/threonine-protein kinase
LIVDHPELLVERYRIGARLGAGGMGTVYAGHDLRLDRAVAVKLLRPELARDPALRRRFEREARSAARVSHPNVVAVYDTGEDTGRHAFIVMELLTGRTLAHELADGPLDEQRLRDVARGVLAALGAAHAEGIVHRDVKPGNVFLTDDDAVKVGDFGIAISLDTGETTTAVPLGTPAYAAPERLRGLPATVRSDLYSLGVVLYEAAAGTRPFSGDGPSEVAEAIVRGDHEPLGRRRPDLSAAFASAVERALATDPEARFADASAMRDALTASPASPVPDTVALAAPTETAILPAPPRAPRVAPRRRFDTRVFALAATIVAALLIVAVVLVVRSADDGATPAPSTAVPTTVAAVPSTPAATVPPTTAPAPEGNGGHGKGNGNGKGKGEG